MSASRHLQLRNARSKSNYCSRTQSQKMKRITSKTKRTAFAFLNRLQPKLGILLPRQAQQSHLRSQLKSLFLKLLSLKASRKQTRSLMTIAPRFVCQINQVSKKKNIHKINFTLLLNNLKLLKRPQANTKCLLPRRSQKERYSSQWSLPNRICLSLLRSERKKYSQRRSQLFHRILTTVQVLDKKKVSKLV